MELDPVSLTSDGATLQFRLPVLRPCFAALPCPVLWDAGSRRCSRSTPLAFAPATSNCWAATWLWFWWFTCLIILDWTARVLSGSIVAWLVQFEWKDIWIEWIIILMIEFEWLLSKQMETPGEMCRWMGGNSLTFNLYIEIPRLMQQEPKHPNKAAVAMIVSQSNSSRKFTSGFNLMHSWLFVHCMLLAPWLLNLEDHQIKTVLGL